MRPWLPLVLTVTLGMGCTETSVTPDVVVDDYEDAAITDELVVDTHEQFGVPAVDVLWVVDNSASMAEEQRGLTNNFSNFMAEFTRSELDLDFHIGVVTTGYDDLDEQGRLRIGIDGRGDEVAWVDRDTRDPVAVFRDMALVGTDGPFEERGRAQVYTALEILGGTENFGFLRRDAYLSVIVLSDEDDRSGELPIGEAAFVDWLRELKDSPEQVSFSSIVPPEEGCPAASEEFGPATSYLHVTEQVGGIVHPICEPSWAAVLGNLGMSAAGLRDTFPLSTLPDRDVDIEVVVKPPREPAYELVERLDFDYDRPRNALVWKRDPPPPNSRITITYAPLR